jgi:hypothetical protein
VLCAAFSGRFLVRLTPVAADYLDVKLAHDWPTGIQRAVIPECRGSGCNNVSAMKPQAPAAPKTEQDKLRVGLPGSGTERKGRIKAAIQANRETLRRLAK